MTAAPDNNNQEEGRICGECETAGRGSIVMRPEGHKVTIGELPDHTPARIRIDMLRCPECKSSFWFSYPIGPI